MPRGPALRPSSLPRPTMSSTFLITAYGLVGSESKITSVAHNLPGVKPDQTNCFLVFLWKEDLEAWLCYLPFLFLRKSFAQLKGHLCFKQSFANHAYLFGMFPSAPEGAAVGVLSWAHVHLQPTSWITNTDKCGTLPYLIPTFLSYKNTKLSAKAFHPKSILKLQANGVAFTQTNIGRP